MDNFNFYPPPPRIYGICVQNWIIIQIQSPSPGVQVRARAHNTHIRTLRPSYNGMSTLRPFTVHIKRRRTRKNLSILYSECTGFKHMIRSDDNHVDN